MKIILLLFLIILVISGCGINEDIKEFADFSYDVGYIHGFVDCTVKNTTRLEEMRLKYGDN